MKRDDHIYAMSSEFLIISCTPLADRFAWTSLLKEGPKLAATAPTSLMMLAPPRQRYPQSDNNIFNYALHESHGHSIPQDCAHLSFWNDLTPSRKYIRIHPLQCHHLLRRKSTATLYRPICMVVGTWSCDARAKVNSLMCLWATNVAYDIDFRYIFVLCCPTPHCLKDVSDLCVI